jgi:hypothetical protein
MLHDESTVEQDVHAKEQVNGELLDEVEATGGKAARALAEETDDDDEEGSVQAGGDEDESVLPSNIMISTDSVNRFEVENILSHKWTQGVRAHPRTCRTELTV